VRQQQQQQQQQQHQQQLNEAQAGLPRQGSSSHLAAMGQQQQQQPQAGLSQQSSASCAPLGTGSGTNAESHNDFAAKEDAAAAEASLSQQQPPQLSAGPQRTRPSSAMTEGGHPRSQLLGLHGPSGTRAGVEQVGSNRPMSAQSASSASTSLWRKNDEDRTGPAEPSLAAFAQAKSLQQQDRPESAASSRPSRSRTRPGPGPGLSGPVKTLADRSAAANMSSPTRGAEQAPGARPLSAQSSASTKTDLLMEEMLRQHRQDALTRSMGRGKDANHVRGTPAGSTGGSLAGTRPSSPVPPELTEDLLKARDMEIRKRLAEGQNPQELEEQLSQKERQVLDLRAQISRCEKQLYGESFPGPRAEGEVVEDPNRDPERTGPRSPALSSASATTTPKANNLEAELAWTVRQMEVHRRQIQAHQLQLGALEKRHAEIITILAAQTSRSSQADPLASSVPEVPTSERLGVHPSNPFAVTTAPKDSAYSGKSNASNFSRPSSAGSHAHQFPDLSEDTAERRSASRPTSAVAVQQVEAGFAGAAEGSDGGAAGGPVDGFPSESGSTARTFSKTYEAERIVFLLTQFGCRRPLRVPFVPLDEQMEGEGRPYLHGSLEVRLCLAPDGNDLMVRVGADPNGDGGRTMSIDEFVDRAEAIEARRVQRPIAEEGEFMNNNAPFMPSPPQTAFRDTAGIQNFLGRKDPVTASGGTPWKKLFKAHWAPK